MVTGRVVNVSAWKDEDKEGKHYRDYFSAATSYETTNFDGWRGTEIASDHVVDLQVPVPAELKGAFDCVFNHTTLEHVFEVHQALATIGDMSRDSILIIVPWMQHVHGPDDGDFWRFSPFAMRRLLAANGFSVLREHAGPEKGKVRYLGYFAARDPQKWAEHFAPVDDRAVEILREPL